MLLANARDEHRNRDVRLYLMPGEFETVGVTDGTDAWVAPVIADPFSVNIARLMQDVREGKIIRPNEVPRKRHRIIFNPQPGPQAELIAKPTRVRIRIGGTGSGDKTAPVAHALIRRRINVL